MGLYWWVNDIWLLHVKQGKFPNIGSVSYALLMEGGCLRRKKMSI